jgi:hypothetical protein
MKLARFKQRGQAMTETLIVAATLVFVMVAFGGVVTAFLDYAYRTLTLISLGTP